MIKVHDQTRTSPLIQTKCCLSACTMAFFEFLRCGEFTTQTEYFDPGVHLINHDITICFHPQLPATSLIHTKASKTDPFRGIRLYHNHSNTCPISALQQYLQLRSQLLRGQWHSLLFPVAMPLTRSFFISSERHMLQRLGLPVSTYIGTRFAQVLHPLLRLPRSQIISLKCLADGTVTVT